MRRICAWCKKDMGDDGSGEEGNTHGICNACAARIEAEEAERLRKERDAKDEAPHKR